MIARLPLVVAILSMSGCAPCARTFVVPEPGLARMLEQPRADDFERSDFFADGKVLQTSPAGAVPFEATDEDHAKPPPSAALLDQGQRDFDVYCAVCHGRLGDGDSVVAAHMRLVRPRDLHIARLRDAPPEWFFTVATSGYGLMRPYSDVLEARRRWGVAWYVKALQRSRHAPVADLPPDVRARLEAAR